MTHQYLYPDERLHNAFKNFWNDLSMELRTATAAAYRELEDLRKAQFSEDYDPGSEPTALQRERLKLCAYIKLAQVSAKRIKLYTENPREEVLDTLFAV